MAAGKNKLLRWLRLYAGGYDLSGDARTIGELLNTFGEVEMFGWSHATKYYTTDGVRQVGIRGFQALMNDAAAGAFSILKNNTVTAVSACLGSLAEPTVGDLAYLLSTAQIKDTLGWDGQAAAITADFLPPGTQTTGNPLGHVLANDATGDDESKSYASIDNLAASTAGWHANLHTLAVSGGGSATVIVEHSTNNSDWVTLGSFTVASAIGSEHISGTDTVNRYARCSCTYSGTATIVVTFARN